MDKLRFAQACAAAQARSRTAGGIGTLGERSLHAALKRYYEPCEENHEVRLGPFVADIVGEEGVIEIQTRGLSKLRRKLEAFLEVARVTVVYPVAARKWLCWIDETSGERVSRRKSPRRGTVYDAFAELCWLGELLEHPRLRLRIVLLEVEEYRLLNGRGADKKRGGVRCERIPLDIVDEIAIDGPSGYAALLPPGLPDTFTSRDFAQACGSSLRLAQAALGVLARVGAVERTGRQGRFTLYRTALVGEAL